MDDRSDKAAREEKAEEEGMSQRIEVAAEGKPGNVTDKMRGERQGRGGTWTAGSVLLNPS